MRGKAPTRFGVRTLCVLVAAACLAALGACTPSTIRVPPGQAGTIRKVAVIPVELAGITGEDPGYFLGGADVAYLAGRVDNAVLGDGFAGVVVDGVPVFYRVGGLDPGIPGVAERFERRVAGPRERWLPSVDLAEIAARRLRAEGVEATAERAAVRLPGVSRRGTDGVPRGWPGAVNGWYGKDPDPIALMAYADRGAQVVLLVAPVTVLPTGGATHVWLFVKLVDPVDGRILGRAEEDREVGPGSRSVEDFPAAFGEAAKRAVDGALREVGLVRPE